MLNLVQNQSNTCYTFVTLWGGVAPYTLKMVSNLDREVTQNFILTLDNFGDRKRYVITPTVMLGTYDYTIEDDLGNTYEIGLAEITE